MVVGAGIGGICAAKVLSSYFKKVTLIDRYCSLSTFVFAWLFNTAKGMSWTLRIQILEGEFLMVDK